MSYVVLLMCVSVCVWQADLLALALLSYKLQELELLSSVDQFTTVVELQYYSQVGAHTHCTQP